MSKKGYKFIYLISIVLVVVVALFTAIFNITKDDFSSFSLSEKFDLVADISCGDFNAKANIRRNGAQNYSIKIIQPSTLKGVEITFANEQMKLSYMGAEFSVNSSEILPYNTINLVVKTIDKVILTGQEAVKSGNCWLYEGIVDKFNYQLGIKDGKFAFLNLPQLDFSMQIQ